MYALAATTVSCRPETPPPVPVTVRAGLLLDGLGGQQRDAVITIVNGRIRSIAPYRSDAVTHDLSGYTVLPGLIDAHVHISGYFNRLGRVHTAGDGETPAQEAAGRAGSALATLRGGFTTVASMGTESDKLLRDAINAGAIPGPRILTSLSPASDADLSPRQLRGYLRRLKARGADFVKIFASSSVRTGGVPTFTARQLETLCDGARRRGLRAVVHAQSDASVRMAAQAGCDEVEHGLLASAEGIRTLAEHGVAFDPQCRLVLSNYLD
ncbi:MAG TPA: amidohydrolase family protein, partial [Gemmatimonadales bacterium]